MHCTENYRPVLSSQRASDKQKRNSKYLKRISMEEKDKLVVVSR
jgi:hypothetical protein